MKIPKKIIISLVKSPQYSSSDQLLQQQLDKDLKEFFSSTSRTFKLNDHFQLKSLNSDCKY